MLPHERSLVKKLEGKPFALVGVDADETRDELKKAEAKHQITWRSFFDGRHGPITKAYNTRFFPMIYILDPKGVIRFRMTPDLDPEELEKEIDHMVEAMVKEARPVKN